MPARPSPVSRTLITARAGFGAVVVAAAVSGFALLLFPESTGEFFSWGLAPPPLAALIGGLYVASALVFGVAMRLPFAGVRSLLAASVALTAPTLVATFIHLEVFDFTRWQAWAWVALFAAAPPFWAVLATRERRHGGAGIRPAGGGRRALVLSMVMLLWAVLLWVEPEIGLRPVPFEMAGLGARFVGAWMAFLAVMAAWFALRPDERLLPAVALAAYPAGALVAAGRTFGDLSPARWWYLAVLAALTTGFSSAAARYVFHRESPAREPNP